MAEGIAGIIGPKLRGETVAEIVESHAQSPVVAMIPEKWWPTQHKGYYDLLEYCGVPFDCAVYIRTALGEVYYAVSWDYPDKLEILTFNENTELYNVKDIKG